MNDHDDSNSQIESKRKKAEEDAAVYQYIQGWKYALDYEYLPPDRTEEYNQGHFASRKQFIKSINSEMYTSDLLDLDDILRIRRNL